jgi:hypothetical protein
MSGRSVAGASCAPSKGRGSKKAEKGRCLLGGQPTLELMIAKFLEARTSDFIEPLHGN